MQITVCTVNQVALFRAFHILSARLNRGHHHGVRIACIGGVGHFAFTVEHEANGAGFTQVAAVFGEGGAYGGGGAVPVVGHRFHDHRHAVRAIAFVADFFVIVAFARRRFLDRAFNHVLGDGLALGFFYGQAQARVLFRIRVAHFCSDGDFFRQLRKQLGPRGVLAAFAVLNVCPF